MAFITHAGVDECSMLRLNGQGDVGLFGGDRGDLHLRFLVSLLCIFELVLGCLTVAHGVRNCAGR